MFKGILVNKNDAGYTAEVSEINEENLPKGDVTVAVSHSTLNYKDALAITGKGPVVRQFPMVPGVDLVGTIEQSDNAKFNVGDKVILNGFGVGEKHWGGLAEKARLKADWLISLPENISPEQAMAIGTAGYTAMLSVIALERQGITPEHGNILVTGANGGVGSYSIAILAKLGYNVVASTGRPEEQDYLIRTASLGMIVGIICAGIIGFAVSWLYGMLAVLISAVITAFVAVVVTQLHLARDKRQDRPV